MKISDLNRDRQKEYLVNNWKRIRAKYNRNDDAFKDFAKRFKCHWRTVENWYYEEEIS